MKQQKQDQYNATLTPWESPVAARKTKTKKTQKEFSVLRSLVRAEPKKK